MSRFPISVRIDRKGRRASIAGLWSHRLDLIDLAGLATSAPAMRVVQRVEIPFPPRCQLWLPSTDRLLIADAFGGRLGLVDCSTGKVIAEHNLDGHGIRGLATTADGQNAVMVCQRLASSPITPETIEAGGLLKSLVSVIPLSEISQPAAKLAGSAFQFTGAWNYENLTDPGGIAPLGSNEFVVTFAGVDRLGVFDLSGVKGTTLRPREQARVGAGRWRWLLTKKSGCSWSTTWPIPFRSSIRSWIATPGENLHWGRCRRPARVSAANCCFTMLAKRFTGGPVAIAATPMVTPAANWPTRWATTPMARPNAC